ncbi:MAG: preprotein translocase subunit SecE [Alphaproteobacteria bacterium]|nr:preprotein translocase subunit SecE [Alphaproteobacteria bacterium]
MATSPAEYIRQVRQEVARVTWPTRKETFVSSMMVLVMAVLAALFFLFVDNVVSWLVRALLNIGV